VATVYLPSRAQSVQDSRKLVAASLGARALPGIVVEDTLQVISELVSNAIVHGAPLPGGSIKLAWTATAGNTYVAVTNGGSATRPVRRDPGLLDSGGRGLRIVDAIAADWGVELDTGTVTVYAHVTTARPAQ
jgi:anti-sigma regulatory factor (Ser/Thr protein kinase)